MKSSRRGAKQPASPDPALVELTARVQRLGEINHRVKNNLVSILGLLLAEKRLSPAEGRPWVEASVQRLGRRVRGLLEANRILGGPEGPAPLLSALAQGVIEGAMTLHPCGSQVSLQVQPSEVTISSRQVSTLVLVLEELANNSLRHAVREGGARISLEGSQGPEELVIVYRDNGPGYPAEVLQGARPGVGLKLVEELIQGTLRGSLALENQGGAVAAIRMRAEPSP